MEHITLSIQEIVEDYERLVRYDEKLGLMFDHENADEDTIDEFFSYLEKLTAKYIPTYKRHVPKQYFLNDVSTYDKALILYNMLYTNFKEIFYNLIN